MRIPVITTAMLALCTWPALAQGGGAPQTVPTSFAFEEIVTLAPGYVVGQTPLGLRRRIPITGGTFAGPGIKGNVVAGGADWQLVRADGSTMVDADYMIETEDHVQIHVHNVGVLAPAKDGKPAYRWTAPVFEAPMGKYGWLNDAVFLSTLGSAGDKDHPAVRITIYRVD